MCLCGLCSGSWQPRLSAGVVTGLTAPHSSAPGTALHTATLHIHQHSTHRTLSLAASTIDCPVASTVSPPLKPVSPSLSSGNPVRGPAVSRCGWPGAGLHQAATHLSMETQPSLALCIVVLQKVPSEANPKVRNHGEGPYFHI